MTESPTPRRSRGARAEPRTETPVETRRRVRGPLFELTWARIIEFARDPAALFWVFGFPVILAVALGIAFREAPKEIPRIAVIVAAPGVSTDPAIVAILDQNPAIAVERFERDAAFDALGAGKVDLVVAPPDPDTPLAAASAHDSPVPSVRFHFDESSPQARLARLAVEAGLLRGLSASDPLLATVDEPVTETGSRYIDFLLPGLIGLNLMGSSMWGIGYAVVDTRKRHLLKRFAVTPMRRADFLLSFMLSRALFLIAEVVLLLVFGWLVFGVGVRGSLIGVALVCMLGAMCFTGIAMLVAARPRSTEAAAGWLNFVMMPMWLLSGVFFSYSRFPDFAQPLIRALPLTAFNDVLRAIMSDGTSLLTMPFELAVMTVWGVVGFALALRIFRWQ